MRANVKVESSNRELHEALVWRDLDPPRFTWTTATAWWVMLILTGLFWYWVAGILGLV